MNVDQYAVLGITQTQRQEPQDYLITGRKTIPQANKGTHDDILISNTMLSGSNSDPYQEQEQGDGIHSLYSILSLRA